MEKQKLKEKSNVVALSVRNTRKNLPNCAQKGNKGITLAALIITIIVLLILAVVAVRAVQGDGIITKAKEAKSKTTVAQEQEQILLAVNEWQIQKNYATNTQKFKEFMQNKLLNNVDSIEGNDEGPLTVIMKDTGKIYIVTDDGTISSKEVDEDLKKYILGQNGEGRIVGEIFDLTTATFLQDPVDSSSKMHEKVKFAYLGEEDEAGNFYIRYKRDIYKFFATEDEAGTIKIVSLSFVNTPAGNLGKYVTYQGKTWIVFRENTNEVELISANALGSVTLGETDFEIARDSYNGAISTLTQACIDATGITENIRNVGGPAADSESITVDDNGFKEGDDNYVSDQDQMKNLGILVSDNLDSYWLASRKVNKKTYRTTYFVNVIKGQYGFMEDGTDLCSVENDGTGSASVPKTYAVRPVVSLSSGILDSATQSGTIDDPIILQ